jgi:DNA-binding CsgD family transcriptional regulator
MKLDCVRIIEAGYAPVASTEAWLGDLVASFEPLQAGWGVLVSAFDIGGADPGLRRSVASSSVPAPIVAAFQNLFAFAAAGPAVVRRTLFAPPPSACHAAHRAARLDEPHRAELRRIFAGTAFRDCVGVAAVEPDGTGLLVSVPCEREISIHPRTVQLLTRVTAHLCSAMRLRARAGEPLAAGDATGVPGVEAILEPSGKVQHATGEAARAGARMNLAAAVRNVERARGHLRRSDPEEALAIWLALFDGRWSIVQRTESDGRRYLLARRNEPGTRDPKALAPAERHVLAYAAMGHSNKYIGYLLGVATSTVSSRLASAIRKLGLQSRQEVIEMFGASATTTLRA